MAPGNAKGAMKQRKDRESPTISMKTQGFYEIRVMFINTRGELIDLWGEE